MCSNRVQRRGQKVERIESNPIQKERKKERKKDRKKLFRVLNNYLGFKICVLFFSLSFLSFFLSLFVKFRASPFLREGACAVDGERQRSARSAEAARFERERERTLRERSFCPSFFFFLQKRALYSIYKENNVCVLSSIRRIDGETIELRVVLFVLSQRRASIIRIA